MICCLLGCLSLFVMQGAPQYIGILGLVGICVKMAVSAFMGK
jgi:hypothetical protein